MLRNLPQRAHNVHSQNRYIEGIRKKKAFLVEKHVRAEELRKYNKLTVQFFVLSTEVFLSCKCINQSHGIIQIMQKSSFHILGLFIHAVIHEAPVYISVQSPQVLAYNITRKSKNIMSLSTHMDCKGLWHPQVKLLREVSS